MSINWFRDHTNQYLFKNGFAIIFLLWGCFFERVRKKKETRLLAIKWSTGISFTQKKHHNRSIIDHFDSIFLYSSSEKKSPNIRLSTLQ
jgi:hypothetical protein